MQSKKGFTLIELLAVLIIIGVIALIVSPIVIKSIKKSGKSTFERSIDGLIESVRIDHSNDSFYAPREYFYEKKDLTLLTVAEQTKDQKIKIHGKIEGNGFIYVDEQGKIHIDNICSKEYCANGPENDIEITPNPGGEIPNHSKTDPMIKLNGDSIIYVGINEPYTELGATARTKLGEKLEYKTEIRSNNETVEYIDTSRENTYEIIYTAENDSKKAEVIRTVIILDMKPVITLTEPNSNYVKEQEVLITVSGVRPNKVSEFSYQINDGEIIKITGNSKIITLNETGIYEIKVTATDNNGHTNTVNKTYRIDRTGPEIVLNPETVELESNEALGYDLLTGVSVTDNIDGTIENSRITIEGELLSIPGEYIITYKVADRLGNESTKTRRIIVKDLTKPEIVITPNETSKFVKTVNIKVTATDNIKVERISYVVIKDGVRGESTTIDNGGSISLNSTGNYEIEVTAIDNSDNSTIKTSGTYKIDTTKPELVFENVTLKVDEVAGYNLMTGVTATDNSGVTPTITYTGGLSATIGTQTITYKATDEAGNIGTKTRTFTVIAADSPIISFTPIKTNGWVKSVNITISATLKIGENLTALSYKISNGTTGNGTISNNTGTASITLNTTGTYTIEATGTGSYNNTKKESSGTYQIDATKPTVGAIGGNTTSWTTSKTLTSTLTDSHSGIVGYAVTTSNTTPTSWTTVTNTASYSLSHKVTANGTYYIWAKDAAGNISTAKSVTVNKIDTAVPVVGAIGGNPTTWAKNATLTSTITDAQSGVTHYMWTTSSTKPAASATGWTSVGTTTTSYAFSKTITANGTYYLWAKDGVGRVSASKSVTVSKIDTTTPTITSSYTSTAYSITEKTSKAVSVLYSVTYGGMGGTVVCKNGTTTVTNLNTLAVGTHTLTCTATGKNGKTASVKPKVTVKAATKTPAEIVTPENAGSNGTIKTDTSGNKRYAGSNPNNYVCFGTDATTCSGKQLWRIIGIVDGNLELVSTVSVGYVRWHYDKSDDGVPNTWWQNSTLRNYLQKEVYDQTTWINSTIHKGWILSDRFKYSDPGYSPYTVSSFENAKSLFTLGHIGLVNVVDIAYGSSENQCVGTTDLARTGNACMKSNWLISTMLYGYYLGSWTIVEYDHNDERAWTVGYLSEDYPREPEYIRVGAGSKSSMNNASPVVVLDSDVKIKSGTGTESNPYILTK